MPEAMALATTGRHGAPAVRYVLLDRCDDRGFVFSCATSSRKAREIAALPRVAVAFYWYRAGRQVRIEGSVEDVSPAEADRCWRAYSRQAKLATRAAIACGPIRERADLVRALAREQRRFARGPVPRPEGWRSYRIVPRAIELWQQRPRHLHHRERFERERRGWRARLLAP